MSLFNSVLNATDRIGIALGVGKTDKVLFARTGFSGNFEKRIIPW